jgi:hypothetical protein
MRESEPAVTRRGGLAVLDAAVAVALATAAAFWNASFHVVPAANGTWRGISDPPSAVRVAAAVAFGALAAWALSRASAAVRRPFLAFFAAALPLVPVLTGRLLPLLVFQGGVLRLLAGGALAVATVRFVAGRSPGAVKPPAAGLFATAFLFFCVWGERVPGPAGPQGDEPHYLVMAQSLLSDGDLDLTDEFAAREYAPFYGGGLAPHTSPNTPPGRLYSMHSPGLPALLLPAYALGGYPGARVFVSALAALTGVLLHRLVRDVTKDERIAAAAWALATFTPPLAFYAVTLYPETPAALAVVAFLVSARATPGAGALAAATALVVVLPWVHTKFIPLAIFGLAFTLLRPYRWAARAWATAALAASLVLLSFYFWSVYGSPSFRAALGPADVSLRRAPWGLAGALLDRQYGLLVVAPVLALAIPGGIALWRRHTGDALRAATLVALIVIPAAAYVGWWGGAAPPARYVLPVVGPLLLAVAIVAPMTRDALAALGGIGFAVLALAAQTPRMLRNRPDGESLLLSTLSPAMDLNGWLPSFIEGGTRAPILAASLLAAAAIAWHWRGRGLIVGVLGYALVANGLRDRPLVDRGQATQRLLWEWDERTDWSASPLAVRGLAVPVELPRRPWTLEPREARNSRRVNLPPGAYRAEIRLRALDGLAVARIEIFAGDLVLATADAGDGANVIPLLLPLGGRGLAVSAIGVTGRAEIDEIAIVPEALVPPPWRDGFPWPEAPLPDRYRVESNGVRVTALDRSTVPEAGGFRVRGDGRFLVEAPAGAVVLHSLLLAGDPEPWSGETETTDAFVLGRTAIQVVIIPAQDGHLTFALKGR